mmetsp:Transcript_31209/g.48914  ORF Transcript_31209/g.48914 Transcript_31209/m.48914 type:complete len:224 (+) Transcript_31209:109-780(+)
MFGRLKKGVRYNGKKMGFQVSVHDLRLAASMPWHSTKTWYHSKARECSEMPEECTKLAVVVKRGPKEVTTTWKPVYDQAGERYELIKWDEDLSLLFTMYPKHPSNKSFVDKNCTVFILGMMTEYKKQIREQKAKKLASVKFNLAEIAGDEDHCKTLQLEMEVDGKPLGHLKITVSCKDDEASPEKGILSNPTVKDDSEVLGLQKIQKPVRTFSWFPKPRLPKP